MGSRRFLAGVPAGVDLVAGERVPVTGGRDEIVSGLEFEQELSTNDVPDLCEEVTQPDSIRTCWMLISSPTTSYVRNTTSAASTDLCLSTVPVCIVIGRARTG